MTWFARTHAALTSGAVICDVAHPDLHRWLIQEGGLAEMGDYLEKVDQKIACTRGGRALYLAPADGSPAAESMIKADAKAIFEEALKVRAFVDFVLKVSELDGPLAPGRTVRFQAIAQAVDRSTSLREELSTLSTVAAVKAATDQTRISGVLRKMAEMGYLKAQHREQETYEVTGKIDLWLDVMEHFVFHVGRVEDAATESQQMAFI